MKIKNDGSLVYKMISNVVIDGSIGAGKSTLLRNLKTKLISGSKIYNIFEENVNSWMEEGWLNKYYTNIPRYASSFQTRVLLSHIEQRKGIEFKENVVNIFERSAITTVNVFSKMLVEDGSLDLLEMNLHKQLLDMFNYEKPDLLIYLDTSPELSYERLLKRSRNGETKITLEYLKKLNDIYVQERETLAKNVVIIDGNRDEDTILNEVISYL